MAYCTYCGQPLRDGANFCRACGTQVQKATEPAKMPVYSNEPVRKIVYSGEILKCPSCGMVLESFLAVCPSCGYELRGVSSSHSIKEFSARINSAPTPAQRLYIIQSYPVPNTKEDILEFMILAASNFDARHFVYYSNYESTSSAWLSKIEQCFQKATLVLVGAELEQIQRIYYGVMERIARERAAQATLFERERAAQNKLLEKEKKEHRKVKAKQRADVLPNKIICVTWIVSLLVLTVCSINAGCALIMFADIIAGTIFIPRVAKSNSSAPRRIVVIGMISSIVILILLSLVSAIHIVLLIVEIIAAIIIFMKMFK